MRIFKGDDTGGTLGKRLMINVHSKYDLTGCVVIFTYQGVTRKWDDVKDGDRLELFFSHNETMKMSVGTFNGVLFAIDAAGKYRTIDNTVKIEVTTNLRACYGADELDVTIGSTVSWDDIINKPFDGVQVDLSTDDRQLAALGTIIEKLGGTVKVGIALVALCAISSFGYTTDTHTNTFVRNGVTYAQRGGMNATTYVVTNIDMTASDVGAVDTNAVRDIIRDEIIPATNRLNQTLSNALDDKRDKSDLAVYSVTQAENTDWTWTGENAEIVEALNNAHSKPYRADIGGQESWADIDPFPFDISRYSTYGIEDADLSATSLWYKLRDMDSYEVITVYATRPRYMDETLGPAKPNQRLAAVATDDAAKPADGSLMKYDAANDRLVKAVEGTDYLKTHQDISGKLDKSGGQMTGTLSGGDGFGWIMNRQGESLDDTLGTFPTYLDLDTKADRATTLSGYGITDAAPLSMISATDTTFASAVRAVPTTDMPEDMPTDWGTYGTVGAALAALAAFVKWAKAKIVAVIGDDGKPTDQFATDLLGKQVANAKVRYALATASSATVADRTVNILTMTQSETLTFPTATTHDGKTYARDFLLKLTYTAGTMELPQGVTKVGDELSFEAGKTYLIAFTEIESDKFYVRSIDITEAQA